MLNFLYTAVSWVMLKWYWLFTTLGMDPNSGVTWALSIVFLVVTARVAMFRLFIKQVHYQRRMQELQPRLSALREKYKNDRAELQRQLAAFQQSEGFNPLAGCLPILVQMPVFIALFHVLRRLRPGAPALYGWTQEQTDSIVNAKLFGVPIIASFTKAADYTDLGANVTTTRVVLVVLTAFSALATHMTQRLAMARNVTPATGQAAMVQKLMLYLIPVFTFSSGFIFPLGVLIYWFTNNTWSMLQQLYINRVHPHVPTPVDPVVTARAKSLAPKPGARPTRPARGASAPTTSASGSSVDLAKGGADLSGAGIDGSASDDAAAGASTSGGGSDSGSGGAPRSAPRPGARPARGPNRPGSRPAGSSKAKKRR